MTAAAGPLALLLLLLAGCTGEAVKAGAARGFESWCRTAASCTVSEPSR